jgi:hypothetical protein
MKFTKVAVILAAALLVALPVAAQGTFSQIALITGWDTKFILINLSTTDPAPGTLSFFGKDGSPVAIQVVGGNSATVQSFNIPAGGSITMALQPGAVGEAWAKLASTNGVLIRGQGIYKYTPIGVAPSEMVVPLDTGYQAPTCIIPFPNLPAPSSTILPFDTTGSMTTAIAVTNISAASKTFDMVYADENNVTIFTDHMTLAANAHTSFLAPDRSSTLAGKKGVLRLTAGPTDISMIAFFYDLSTGAFGTIFPNVK